MRYARGMQAAVVLILFAGSRERALALNPSLDVSQYAHNSWKIRDGFFAAESSSWLRLPMVICGWEPSLAWFGSMGFVRFPGRLRVTSGFPASGS